MNEASKRNKIYENTTNKNKTNLPLDDLTEFVLLN